MDIMVFSLRSECFVSRKKFEIRTFKMADVTISEDRLKTLMKEIFKEEFEKQQKNLLNLISWNFDITMTEIKKVQSDINELKASLEHTETVLEEKVAKAEKKIEKLKEQINELWDYQVAVATSPSNPVAVTSPSDFAPASSKEFLDIQATIECGFTLKRVRDMIKTYSQMHRTDKYSQHSSIIWPAWLNG